MFKSQHASACFPVVVLGCLGPARQFTTGWNSLRSAPWIRRPSAARINAGAGRRNKRNGRAAIEHRRDELGVEAITYANPQTGSDGAGRRGRRPGHLLAKCLDACAEMHDIDAYRPAIAEARRRRDGASTSNRYRLLISGGDNLSLPHVTDDTHPRQGCRGDPDAPVTPGITDRIVIDPPQPGAGDEQRTDPADAETGSGAHSKLEYPKGLSSSERADTQRRLARPPPELAQQLLDELAARLKAGTIRISPFVYLAGLIKRANAGKFVPEAALQVTDAREKRRRSEAYMQRLQALNDQPMPEKTDVADCPLAKRFAEIRLRSRGHGEDGGSTCD